MLVIGGALIQPTGPTLPPWTVQLARRAGIDTALDWFCREVQAAGV